MAQIKKLQNGSTIPKNQKLIYNGVELDENDINQAISHIGDWGAKNANYSTDIRDWSNLGEQVKSELLKGTIPQFDTTGTGFTLGSLNIQPGKSNQNIFGNWTDSKLGSQYSNILRSTLNQIAEQKKEKNNNLKDSSNSKNLNIYKNPIDILSNKYYSGKLDLFESGFGNLDLNERRLRTKEALKESINDYNQRTGTKDIDPNVIDTADDKTLSDIGYKIGYDIKDFLSSGDKTTLNFNQDYESDLGKYAISKGFKYGKNSDGKYSFLNEKGENVDFNPYIETGIGNYYGYALLQDPITKEYKFGLEDSFKNTNLYQLSSDLYSQYRNKNKENIPIPQSVDFNSEQSNIFSTDYYKQFRENNKFNFHDISNSFSNISSDKNSTNRLIIPKNKLKTDILGAPDLKNSEAIMILNGKTTPVNLEINANNDSYAITPTGEKINLGTFGGNNSLPEWTSFKYNIDLGKSQIMNPIDINNSIKSVSGFNSINEKNIKSFINSVINNKFSQNLQPNESKRLAQYLINLYNKSLKGKNILSSNELNKLRSKISELNESVSDIPSSIQSTSETSEIRSSSPVYKKGGILKAQMGTKIIKSEQKNKPKLIEVEKPEFNNSGSTRLGDKWKTEDTLDSIATGLNFASLSGGAVGVGASAAATLIQAAADYERGGISKDMLTNLGINLGFTALSFIPGASAAKILKAGKNVSKLKNAKAFINETENAVKLLSKSNDISKEAKSALKAVNKAKEVIESSKDSSKFTKFIEKARLNPITQAGSTAARLGFSSLGVLNGIEGVKSAYDDFEKGGVNSIQLNDIRKTISGIAGTRAALGIGKNYLIRKGTEPINVVSKQKTELNEDAKKLDKFKSRVNDIKTNLSNSTSNKFTKYVTSDWNNRKLKGDDKTGILTNIGKYFAKKSGFTEKNSIGINQKLVDVLNKEAFSIKPNKRLALPMGKPKSNINNPNLGKQLTPAERFQEKLATMFDKNKQLAIKTNIVPFKPNSFKNGGFIQKLQNGKNIYNLSNPDLTKKEFTFDKSFITELPKLFSALNTNKRNLQILSSVTPTLLQAPKEIYKPVYTNLSNEANVQNQIENYKNQTAKQSQGTSDYNTRAAINLEGINKILPTILQSKAENSNLYNQSLENSRESSANYAGQRNEIANQNRQIIDADQAMKARYIAGKNIADNASWANYYDTINETQRQKDELKNAFDVYKKTQEYQKAYDEEIKPFKEKFENINKDYKLSNTYKEFEPYYKLNSQFDWNSSDKRSDNKTWKQAYTEELQSLKNEYDSQVEKRKGYYSDLIKKLQFQNLNSFTFKFKSGGEIDSKIEVQQLKNRLKIKELNNKSFNKSMELKQREVEKILSGLSKETFFLLKTVLGK